MRNIFFSLGIAACLVSCNNQDTATGNSDSSSISTTTAISETRTDVKKEPVAVYDVPLKNDLNKWHFTVTLSETRQRFFYLLDMKYEELTASDTIRFPNFGLEPEPLIQKGANDLECIIGFADKEKKFREYLKVFVDHDQLRVKTLKQYTVYQK